MTTLKREIAKCIRIMFPENKPDRVQRVLQRLRDDNAKDHHVPGSLTWLGRCAVDHAAADIIEQLAAERDAAVRDMTEIVQEYGEPYCEYCGADFKPNCTGRCWTHNEGFKWRGVQKEE